MLAKRLIVLAKQPKTLANVTLAKSLVGEITAIRFNKGTVGIKTLKTFDGMLV